MESLDLAALRRRADTNPLAPLVIFGAGDLGKIVHHWLRQNRIAVTALVDDSSSKIGKTHCGVPIEAPASVAKLEPEALILIASNYFSIILPRLAAMGRHSLSDCSRLFDDRPIPAAGVDVHPLEIGRKIQWHRREVAKWQAGSDQLILKYIDVVITEACSMKCADCSNLMQYYVRPKPADNRLLLQSLDQLFAATDWIDEIRLLGGEPLLNKQLDQIIDHIRSHQRFSHIVIYSNATILPGPALLAQLADPRVTVSITDYGALSRNLAPFVSLLEEHGVAHIVKRPEWTDSGRIRPQERSVQELDAMFARCCVNDILTLLHGQIYRCPFTANATNLGVVPLLEDEVVTVGEDAAAIRDALRSLYGRTTHLAGCTVCSGRDFSVPKITPAVQTRRPLPLPVPGLS